MFKVVFPKEAARIDQLAISAGCSEEAFVMEAGRKVATRCLPFAPKKVTLLVGKGNKGADCLAAGIALKERGVEVEAFFFFLSDSSSPINQKLRALFPKHIDASKKETFAFDTDLIIDGLFGTGFTGQVKGNMETAIWMANCASKPIIAIDLPSGLNGTTGMVENVAIEATATVALGFAKIGCFLRKGWNHVGKLSVEDFGLPLQWQERAHAVAWLPEKKDFTLPKIVRNRHKYEAGYLVGVAGSSTLRGAPKLAGLAALRAGAGIVRIFHKEEIGEMPNELIGQKWNLQELKKELKRATALFIGPGMGKLSLRFLKECPIPLIVDADGLQEKVIYPKKAILTPHRGEMARLLGWSSLPFEEELLFACAQFVERHQVILLLKGGPTFLFAHGKMPLILMHGDPGMATAGSGDVLTGIIGALLAQKLPPYEAAALGAILHGIAGEIAAAKKGSYGLIASDLIDALPEARSE